MKSCRPDPDGVSEFWAPLVYHIRMISKPATSDERMPSDAEGPGGVPPIDSPLLLVGAGIVGRAIFDHCLGHGLTVCLADVDASALARVERGVMSGAEGVRGYPVSLPVEGLSAIGFGDASAFESFRPWLVLESITERLDLKQNFFAAAARAWGPACVLATNTSNLRVADVFAAVPDHPNALGMHFFMPVGQRPLVELIPREATPSSALESCREFALRLGKDSLQTGDQPGFVVNRLLAPYLNQSLLLLGRGVGPSMLHAAALRFGMPMSPLELIDRIGIRTAFDSGRVFWRAFPKRIDPAPILPGMIKAGRLGAVAGGGFFDPARIDEKPGDSHPVDPIAQAVIARYAREARVWDLDEVVVHLAAPMWIEAAEILADRVVRSTESIELGLRGGLGYRRDFIPFCDSLGGSMLKVIRENSEAAAFNAGQVLIELLEGGHWPASALNRYAGV